MALELISWLLLAVYTISAVGLALYGLHALWLVLHLGPPPGAQDPPPGDASIPQTDLPRVTVQLPVFNERHVVLRLLDACARFDYPGERLQIQVLDDSTDQTTALVGQRAAYWRDRGVDVQVLHRQERTGFKAGALVEGLAQATGDLIAIFDADFQPPVDFLRRIAPHFAGEQNARLGFVQARWGHLNPSYSALTRCQALALDGHFVVEQAARQQAGYPFGFNGSAGVWRRACIEDPAVGGWQADTLCEDLDLSYRAQLAGWQSRYLNDLEAPAEIPPQLLAFKRQQFRWAKGSIQTLGKLGAAVWRSGWPLPARVAGLVHLGSYLVHPFLLLLLLITVPLLLLDLNPFWPLAYLSLASVGPPLLYAVAQRRLHGRGWLRRWAYLPLLTLFGTGLCLSNTQAVWQALRKRPSPFLRTPKFRVEQPTDSWRRSSYVLGWQPLVLAEGALMFYAIGGALIAAAQYKWWTVPFLLLYAASFATMVLYGVGQSLAPQQESRLRMRRPRIVHPGPSNLDAPAPGGPVGPGIRPTNLVKSRSR